MPIEGTNDTAPVILIGLDAAEIDVVDRLVAAGRMPYLARLWMRTAGSTGRRTCMSPAAQFFRVGATRIRR